jgi:hypothetical protein
VVEIVESVLAPHSHHVPLPVYPEVWAIPWFVLVSLAGLTRLMTLCYLCHFMEVKINSWKSWPSGEGGYSRSMEEETILTCFILHCNSTSPPKKCISETRCVMKHKYPCTRQIPEVAIIVKTQGQDFKIYGSNIKVLSQGTCIWNTKALSLTIQNIWPKLSF